MTTSISQVMTSSILVMVGWIGALTLLKQQTISEPQDVLMEVRTALLSLPGTELREKGYVKPAIVLCSWRCTG